MFAAKSKGVETGGNLAEFCKEGYGSKRAVLPIVMMMNSFGNLQFH
jgi:hypothetical protein